MRQTKRKKFITYTNKNSKIAVYGGMLILLLCILGPVLSAPKEELVWQWAYLIFIFIYGFFIYVILASFLKFFIRFEIRIDGLLIKKPFFHRKLITYNEIEQVILLSKENTLDFFTEEIKSQYGFKDDVDVSGYFSKIRKESSYYRYLTIAPSGTSVGSGQAEQVSSVKVNAEMIAIFLKDKQRFYISTENIHEFYKSLQSHVH